MRRSRRPVCMTLRTVAILGLLAVLASACGAPASSVTVPSVAPSAAGSPIPPTTGSPAASAPASDGLPTTFQGEPVYRGDAIEAHVAADTSASPFYVGGWLSEVQASCAPPPSGRPTSVLAPWCPSGWYLSSTASGQASGVPALYIVRTGPVTGGEGSVSGPVILRVHSHDPQAAACPTSIRILCEQAIVAEAVLWVGKPAASPGAAS